jgi:hypothetical protein
MKSFQSKKLVFFSINHPEWSLKKQFFTDTPYRYIRRYCPLYLFAVLWVPLRTDPHNVQNWIHIEVNSRIRIRINIKIQALWRLKTLWTRSVEAQKMEPRRVR